MTKKLKATTPKKTIYIILTMLLGLLLAEIGHALIEIAYIKEALRTGVAIQTGSLFGSYCYLPAYFEFILYLAGIIGGYFLGQTWWRIVYVEKRHWRFRKNK